MILVSSLSAVAFVTGNAFAKKSSGGGNDGGGGGSSGDKGGSSKDNGGDKGGGSSTDNTGGGGSDNTNAGSGDTSGSATSPPPVEENTSPPPAENQQQTVTCPDGSTADTIDKCPNPSTSGTTPVTCPDGSTADTIDKCPNPSTSGTTPVTCPDGSTADDSGSCPTTGTPTIAGPNTFAGLPTAPTPAADGGFDLPTIPAAPVLGICPGGFVKLSGKCVLDVSCPNGTTKVSAAHCAPTSAANPPPPPPPKLIPIGDGSFRLPTMPAETGTGTIAPICPKGSHLVLSKCVIDGANCPDGTDQDGDICRPQLKSTTTPAPSSGGSGGATSTGTTTGTTSTQTGGTTGPGGTTTGGGTTPEPPTELEVPVKPGTVATCPEGTRSVGAASTKPGEGSFSCLAQKTADGTFILPSVLQSPGSNCNPGYISVGGTTCVLDISCPNGTTKIGATQCVPNKLLPASTTTTSLPAQTGNAGTGGTTTNTGGATTPATTTTTPSSPATSTSSTTTTNVIGGRSSVGGGGGSTTTAASPPTAQAANNNFLTYVNAVNKISIKYPSTWTKTELTGNPTIPVMFNAPITAATTTATAGAKTNFVISITPGAANLDGFTQQQINGLSQSKAIKYTITDTNAKVLTPPTGITAYREISYDGMKNGNGVQVPLRGAAIFFVSGGTGYSLLYLAKQTEYTQNLPTVQQMVNSFQLGSGAAASGGPVQNVAAGSGSSQR